MKILAIGCGGMLGEAIYKEFSKQNKIIATDIDLNEKWLRYLDVRDYSQIKEYIIKFKPDLIINLSALTDLEYQELNPKEAYETNFMGVINISLLCKQYDIPLVQFSTAGVFDGKKDKYYDFDEPNPLNHYAKSKHLAEIFVQKNLEKYYLIRPGWMMGGEKDKKFVSKILKQINDGKKTIYAIENLYGVPTYTYDLAKNLKELIKEEKYGTYNMVCEGEKISRYDVAKEIIKVLKVDVRVEKVDTSYFEKEYPVKRPTSEALVNNNLEKINLNLMRNWKVCLREYLE